MPVLEMFGIAIPHGMNTEVNIYLVLLEETIGIITAHSSHCFIKEALNKPGALSVTGFCN